MHKYVPPFFVTRQRTGIGASLTPSPVLGIP